MLRIGEQCGAAPGGQEGFEENGGGDLIDEVFAVKAGTGGASSGAGGSIEAGVGLEGGEALIEEMVGEGRVLAAELGGEGLRFCGLRARAAIGVEREAYDEGVDVVLADKARDRFEVGAQSGAMKGEERLRSEAEGIGQRQADAAVANVQREDASFGHQVSVGASLRRLGRSSFTMGDWRDPCRFFTWVLEVRSWQGDGA